MIRKWPKSKRHIWQKKESRRFTEIPDDYDYPVNGPEEEVSE